jgi:FMN-dependent NADH-azoreductase
VPTLLYIDASPRGDYSLSRKLSAAFAAKWEQTHPSGTVIRRDLPTSKLSFVDLDWIAGAYSAPDQHSEGSKQALAISDTLIAELLAADTIVIGTPMYNFNVPAVLKAWIDHVVRVRKTFAVTDAGLKGLATGKRVIVTVAAGATYDSGFMKTMDFVTP